MTGDACLEALPARVLHLTYGLDFGGVETHLRLIAATPGKRFVHDFAAIGPGGAAEAAIRALGGTVVALGIDPHQRPLAAIRALLALTEQLRPAVVHAHGAEGNLFGLTAAALARVPVRIGEEIGLPDHSLRARLTFRMIYRSATRVIGVADAVRDWLVQSGEVPPCKALRLYNPVQLPSVAAAPRRAGDPLRIGFLGRLDAVKNPAALIAAVASARGHGVNCAALIIGDGPQRGELDALIRRLGVAEAVQLAGYQDAPHALLATCHLYAQPSLSEGFGIALVEAMGCALPVIASSVGGMVEIVTEGRTGWILPAPTAAALEAAIRHAAALAPDELAAIGRAARESVADRFAAPDYICTLETLYDKLLLAKAR